MGNHNFSAAQRRRILSRCQEKCFYCGRRLHLDSSVWENTKAEMSEKHDLYCHLDHVEAHSKGGAKQDENLVACCRTCNSSKGNKTLEEYRAYLEARQPHRVAALLIQQTLDTAKSPYDEVLIASMNWHESQVGRITFAGERLVESRVLS